jgi:general secretion pathway protein A
VEWLDRQLSIARGQKPQPKKNLVYDKELMSQVKKFQLSVGLVPDGVVGTQTVIHLNNAVGSNEPVLVKRGR